jgi:hypothetical protein
MFGFSTCCCNKNRKKTLKIVGFYLTNGKLPVSIAVVKMPPPEMAAAHGRE